MIRVDLDRVGQLATDQGSCRVVARRHAGRVIALDHRKIDVRSKEVPHLQQRHGLVASTDGVVVRRLGADKPGLHVSGDTGSDRFVEHDPDFDDRIFAGAKTRNVEGTLNQFVVSSWV